MHMRARMHIQVHIHSRTHTLTHRTAQDKIKKGFGPVIDGFRHVPYNDLQAHLPTLNSYIRAPRPMCHSPTAARNTRHAAS